MGIGFSAVFISLVVAGIMYFLSPVSAQLMAEAKDRIGGAISGLLLLLLTYLVITTINPELKFFKTTPLLSATPLSVPEIENPGVSFYNNNCTPGSSPVDVDRNVPINIYNISDLGDLKNEVTSAKIIQGSNVSYISILYDNPGFWGKCLYLNPNTAACQPAVDPYFGDAFADSASIYRYDFSPNGSGISLYRNSYFDKSGGFLNITNNQIKSSGGLYVKRLDELYFLDDDGECSVPEKEQDCVKYNEKGKCSERRCPSLAGENVSSIKINGGYLVMLTYAGPGMSCDDVAADSCQEFPKAEDINKTGPQQIKWEHIRNDGGVIPNCLTIIPVKF